MTVSPAIDILQHLRSLFLKQDATGATDESLLEAYLSQRDEAAFEALVRRHGPMVLGVCRRILGNCHDAEDAFQAAFLVLVRKAATIRPRSMVGNWLYGVACRTALDARRAAAKRRAKEAAVLPRTNPLDDRCADLRAVLDEELQRLPPKCRAVIVLSDLEGKTRKEVALQLGWPEGSVASRLARARGRLAKRLARHGLVGSGVAVGTLLSESASSASVPTSLVVSTVKAGSLLAAGQAATGTIPAQVAALMEGVLKAMLLNRVLKTSAVLLVVVALGTGTGLALSQASKTDSQERKATSAEQRTAEAKAQAPSVIQSTGAGRDTHPSRGTDSQKVSDSDKLQGSWIVVSDEYFGRTEKAGAKQRLVISQSRFVMESDGETMEKGTFTIDEAKKPRTIDFSIAESPLEGRKENKILGIYAVEGDTLKICWTEIGGTDRPTDFVADTKHPQYNVLTYKRQK